METYERRKKNKARARHEARHRRRAPMATPLSRTSESQSNTDSPSHTPTAGKRSFALPDVQGLDRLPDVARQAQVYLADAVWYVRHNPAFLRWVGGGVAVLILLYFLSFFVSGRIAPNVRIAGIGVGGQSVNAAAETLRTAWADTTRLKLVVAGETVGEIAPDVMGIHLDSEESASAARGVGLGAIPFGASVDPVLNVDFLTAQTYLLDLAEIVDERPVNASYEWDGSQVIGIDGREGRRLNVPLTLERLTQNTVEIVERGRLELLMIPLEPEVDDPGVYLDEVRALAADPPAIRGYDPFTNQFFNWSVDNSVFTSWIQAGPTSLTMREDTFLPFLEQVNQTLNVGDLEAMRYIARDEAMDSMRDTLLNNEAEVSLRVRYRDMDYVVESGDSGYAISRKTGVPFYNIQQANSGVVWEALSVGQTIRVPSRDIAVPEDPVPHKRIVVDLGNQMMVAYEHGQEVFRWQISSGVSDAPTSPGVYQILSHREKAYGSSNTLCDSAGLVCGQWEMNWFMGIYEVVPGLVNGFHGAVLLPNGNYLNGGNGYPSTFGCVMSNDTNARLLYEWAEVGTVVEIISNEFEPISDLGQLAQQSL